MTNPYTLPPYSNDSTNSVNSAPTAFYTMKMYETPVESAKSPTSPPHSRTRYLPPQEIPYHLQNPDLPQSSLKESGAAGSAAEITFTNPFLPLDPLPRSPSTTNISNQVANVAGTAFQPLYATFGREPVFVSCPYCQHTDETIAVPVIGTQSVLFCLMVPVVGLFFKSKWDTRHQCKCCLNIIGTHYAE